MTIVVCVFWSFEFCGLSLLFHLRNIHSSKDHRVRLHLLLFETTMRFQLSFFLYVVALLLCCRADVATKEVEAAKIVDLAAEIAEEPGLGKKLLV